MAERQTAGTAAESTVTTRREVPFFKPDLGAAETDEVVAVLKSGWLTTGPRVRQFEREFAETVGAAHALAVNSATAALHLAIEALGLQPGQGVLVPTMTFAATAEVLHYLGALPVLVDCDPRTLNMDLEAAERAIERWAASTGADRGPRPSSIVGIMPVHVGGLMMDVGAVRALAHRHGLWVVEDAAHALPAAWRPDADAPWEYCGGGTGTVTAFSFYANKTITTGEGGMATTADPALAERMRLMSLHGLTRDAWDRYSGGASWDYRIVAAGYKYNLTDIAAAIGIHQLRRAEPMRRAREARAHAYLEALADLSAIELPPTDSNRLHAWHLFPLRLHLDQLAIDRNRFIDELRAAGVGCSVHWRPLHAHPYYQQRLACDTADFPVATAQFERLVSIPLYSTMSDADVDHVIDVIRTLSRRHRR